MEKDLFDLESSAVRDLQPREMATACAFGLRSLLPACWKILSSPLTCSPLWSRGRNSNLVGLLADTVRHSMGKYFVNSSGLYNY